MTARPTRRANFSDLIPMLAQHLHSIVMLKWALKRKIREQVPLVDPSDFDVGFSNEMVLNYCRREGLVCHDITPALISAARESPAPLYKPRDTHWNVRGNRIAAAAEAAFLRAVLLPTVER